MSTSGTRYSQNPRVCGEKARAFFIFSSRASGSSSNGLGTRSIFSQIPVADSVHVGKNIADIYNGLVKKKFGVKTRWLENLRGGYNKINNLRQRKLFLEERKFLPIIKIEARHAPVLCKTICPEFEMNLGIKFTLPTHVIRNYVLEP